MKDTDADSLSNDADRQGQDAGLQRNGVERTSGELPGPLPPPSPALPPLDPIEPDPFRTPRFAHPKSRQNGKAVPNRRRQRWTTPTKIAAYMGCDPDTIRNWLRKLHLAGKVEHSKHYSDDRDRKTARGKWRVFEGDLTRLLRAMRARGPLGFGPGFWEGKD